MASEYQKMIAGEPYRPSDPELRTLAQASRQKQAAFNKEEEPLKGADIIKTWFGSTGQNLYVNPRLVVDYGVNIHLGENFYSNWNLTMLDVCPTTASLPHSANWRRSRGSARPILRTTDTLQTVTKAVRLPIWATRSAPIWKNLWSCTPIFLCCHRISNKTK